jgi:hypothetical protein
MKEDYVSFETAKLLNEKGFNEDTICVYIGRYLLIKGEGTISNATDMPIIPAPTLQMAMKWLRIKHNLCVTPVMTSKAIREKYGCWEADIYYYKGEFAGIDATINACGHIFGETPEKALEEGIKYCLENLI